MDNYLRVYAQINLDNIYYNITKVREKIGPDVKLIAVIKADAYGHGAVEVGVHLQDIADGFAIAVVEEGIQLRRNGIHKPLLILGYTSPKQYPQLLEYDIEQCVYSYEMAGQLSEVASVLGKTAKIHIKLDTGMGRIGFLPNEDSIEEIKKIAQLDNLRIEGIFTHFSKADMCGTEYTQNQFETFVSFVKRLEKEGVKIPVHHCANSAAIMDYPNTYLNQVRSGIITYGLYPSDEVCKEHLDIRPALELKTHVIHVKEVPEGTSIGYGGTFVTKRPSRIATIPVGYGDGYLRSLSNKGRVLINGQSAPIVGRVCMDQFMVDVTDLDGVSVEEEVTLIGENHGAYISVEEVAQLAGSFNYEFCCDIGKRVPRVYYKNGQYYKTVDYFHI